MVVGGFDGVHLGSLTALRDPCLELSVLDDGDVGLSAVIRLGEVMQCLTKKTMGVDNFDFEYYK